MIMKRGTTTSSQYNTGLETQIRAAEPLQPRKHPARSISLVISAEKTQHFNLQPWPLVDQGWSDLPDIRVRMFDVTASRKFPEFGFSWTEAGPPALRLW
jgi:hypothetical protein